MNAVVNPPAHEIRPLRGLIFLNAAFQGEKTASHAMLAPFILFCATVMARDPEGRQIVRDLHIGYTPSIAVSLLP